MRRHQIGDNWVVNLSFADSAGGIICQASTTVLDIDRNGRGLSPSCPSNSRFEDNIDQLSGPGLTTSTFGNLIETPAGNFVSSLNCKTSNTENLGLAWSSPGTVTGATFRWRAGTPPGNDTRLDYQVIQIQPMVLCVVPGSSSGRAVAYPASPALKPITTADDPADD